MRKEDFMKNQEGFLRVIPGSNAARRLGIRNIGESPEKLVLPGTVSSVGRKYITVMVGGREWDTVRFNIENDFRQESGRDYDLFPTEKDAADCISADILYDSIRKEYFTGFRRAAGKLSLEKLTLINQAIQGEEARIFSVDTPKGAIVAKQMPDDNYPGIALLYRGMNGEPGAIMEYEPVDDKIQLRWYSAEDPDGEPAGIFDMTAGA